MLALVALLLAAEPAGVCSADADCAVAKPCDCGCCSAPVQAMTQAEAKALRARCATLGPCDRDGCAADDCLPPESTNDFTAVCKDRRCVRVAKRKPAACTFDSDCVLAEGCSCACCPKPPEAMTKPEAAALKQKCATLGDCGQSCQAAKCTPLPAEGWDARCVQGVCTRQQRKTSK